MNRKKAVTESRRSGNVFDYEKFKILRSLFGSSWPKVSLTKKSSKRPLNDKERTAKHQRDNNNYRNTPNK
jgi:hypothetical protein